MNGKRLASLRKELGLTQKEVANKLNVTPKAISFYELEQREPSDEALLLLAEIFNVSTDYLLGLSDDRQAKITSSSHINETIAAHLDGAELSETDIEDIADYIEFVKQKRAKQ